MFAAQARGDVKPGTAERWAHETKGISKLPEVKKAVGGEVMNMGRYKPGILAGRGAGGMGGMRLRGMASGGYPINEGEADRERRFLEQSKGMGRVWPHGGYQGMAHGGYASGEYPEKSELMAHENLARNRTQMRGETWPYGGNQSWRMAFGGQMPRMHYARGGLAYGGMAHGGYPEPTEEEGEAERELRFLEMDTEDGTLPREAPEEHYRNQEPYDTYAHGGAPGKTECPSCGHKFAYGGMAHGGDVGDDEEQPEMDTKEREEGIEYPEDTENVVDNDFAEGEQQENPDVDEEEHKRSFLHALRMGGRR